MVNATVVTTQHPLCQKLVKLFGLENAVSLTIEIAADSVVKVTTVTCMTEAQLEGMLDEFTEREYILMELQQSEPANIQATPTESSNAPQD